MAKKDSSFFDRLREVGLRKSVARQLSEAGDDAGKKLQQAARATAKELRAVADEIERRLPATDTTPRPGTRRRTSAGSSRASASPRTARSAGAGTRSTRSTASRPASPRTASKPASPRTASKPAAPRASGSRASGSGTTRRTTRQSKPSS